MNVVTKLKMDLAQTEQTMQLFCVQGDSFSRRVEMELLAEGTAWPVPDGTSVVISYCKPDGTCGAYEQMPDGTQAWEIDQNLVTFSLTPQMLTAAGLVSAQLKLVCGEKTISTFAFHILVRPGIAPGDDSENYIAWLTAYLPQTAGSQEGQYLRIAQVDDSGRVTELIGTEIDLPPDHTDRIQSLEERTGGLEQMEQQITELEEEAAEIPELASRVSVLENDVGAIPQLGNRVTALEKSYMEIQYLDERVTTLETNATAITQLENRVKELEDNTGVSEELEERIKTLEDASEAAAQLESRVQVLEDGASELSQLGDRVQTLEDGAEIVAQLETRITNLENGTPAYPAVWDSAVDSCIQTVCDYQEASGTAAVSFAYFSDHHNKGGYAGALIAKVIEETGMPYSFYCGDTVSPEASDDTQAADTQLRAFNTMMAPISREKDRRTLGENDYCRTDSSGNIHALNTSQIYERFFRKQLLGGSCAVGSEGTYYYLDDKIHKIRFIVLNSVSMDPQYDDEGNLVISEGYGFGQEQLEWLVNDALQFQETDWGVVFIAHSPLSNQGTSNLRDAYILQGILTAFVTNGTYQARHEGYNSVNMDIDFQETVTADLIGWFSGHTHENSITTLELSNDPELISFPLNVVTIASDADDSYTGEPEQAIDFVTIARDQRTVFLTRLGTGEDRSFSYY